MNIQGTVRDARTGQPLGFANVYYSNKDGSPATTNVGTTTNAKGYYNLGDFVGSLRITASYLGYKRVTKWIPEKPSPVGYDIINFDLEPQTATLPGVNIVAPAISATNWPRRIIIVALAVLGIWYIYKKV